MSNPETESIGSWSERIAEAPIVAAKPLDALVKDLERRLQECQEERPNESPAVSLEFVLDRLPEARNRAASLDEWLDYDTVAEIGSCHRETVRRRAQELPEDLVRRNGLNGRHEIHLEGAALLLDIDVDDVREEVA